MSRPLAVNGSRGTTTLSPGVCVKYDSGDCEWYSPPCPTAPYGVRMVRPAESNMPPERKRIFAASFVIWSNAGKI